MIQNIPFRRVLKLLLKDYSRKGYSYYARCKELQQYGLYGCYFDIKHCLDLKIKGCSLKRLGKAAKKQGAVFNICQITKDNYKELHKISFYKEFSYKIIKVAKATFFRKLDFVPEKSNPSYYNKVRKYFLQSPFNINSIPIYAGDYVLDNMGIEHEVKYIDSGFFAWNNHSNAFLSLDVFLNENKKARFKE
jgi:hypothetical protein